VPRSRFLPVKSTNDLLVLRSDAYTLDQAELNLAAGRGSAPEVNLSNPYKLLGDFENRFSFGAPSLVEARSLTVRGDVRWGRDVVVRGSVTVDAAVQGPAIADGSLLEG
jgi:UTP--glucose-1-phosphate uridylyltransferase